MFLTIASVLLSLAISNNTAPAPSLDACQTEDSTNCFWDADVQGNGKGVSFHDINGVAYYACEADEDSANCFWDAEEQGNHEGRSFTDVGGVAYFWDTIS